MKTLAAIIKDRPDILLTECYEIIDTREKNGQCIWCGEEAIFIHILFPSQTYCSPKHADKYLLWYCEVEGK